MTMAAHSSTTAGADADERIVVFPFGEPDMRLEDFLDDKLQSTADLDTIDALLARVGEQHAQLQSQLDEAAQELEAARGGAQSQRAALREQIGEFEALERSVDERLAAVNGSDAPEAVIQQLAGPLQQLQRVTVAHDYLVLLQDVADLAAAARAQLPDTPRAALAPYGQLRRLAARLAELQTDAADTGAPASAPHLVAHVAAVADGLWTSMNQTMRASFAALLEERHWPAGVDAAVPADATWRDGFAKLLDLQAPDILARCAAAPGDDNVLLPVDVMADIFAKEFRYHFLAPARKTSDPRQIGEVCFPWLLDRIATWADFLRASFADLLAARFDGTPAADRAVYVDPACAFVAALLPVVREKVAQTAAYAVQELPKQPAFLGGFIVQLHELDDALRDRFGYDGGCGDPAAWPGLAAPVLDAHFAQWLQAEKDGALARYRDTVDAPETRGLDYDYDNVPGRTKPTLAAVRVVELLRAVTAQYRRVRRFAHRLRFLIDIQVTLLDAYDDRLRGSLEAYSAMTSTVGRTLHGVTKDQLAALEGTGGLETLCRVYGSADHVVGALRDWGDDEFFVLLWDELQTRAHATTHTGQDDAGLTAAGGLSYDAVRARTSEADSHGILFDETIQAFSRRRQTAQEFLVTALADSHRKAFRPYVLRTQWTTVAADAAVVDPSDLTITAELDEPLRIIKRNVEFLSRALGTAVLRRTVRGALEKLQEMLWSEVLVVQSFTALGAAQFARDIAAVAALVEQHLPRASVALEGLREGVRLLNLPAAVDNTDNITMTLQQASDGVFTDNTEAKRVLRALGLTTLTPANARLILQRRVENST